MVLKDIDCSKKENWSKKYCKQKVGEGEFSMILPKKDNAGNRINPKIHEKVINDMNEQFGGTTTSPVALGCFKSEETGDFDCEENIKVSADRIFFDENKNAKERSQELKSDFRWLKKKAKQVANKLGQESVIVDFDRMNDVDLIEGNRKGELSKDKIKEKGFESYI